MAGEHDGIGERARATHLEGEGLGLERDADGGQDAAVALIT